MENILEFKTASNVVELRKALNDMVDAVAADMGGNCNTDSLAHMVFVQGRTSGGLVQVSLRKNHLSDSSFTYDILLG